MDKKCFECKKPATVKHHVVPKSLGGTRTVPLCADCHKIVHSLESKLALGKLQRAAVKTKARKPYHMTLEKCHELEKLKGKVSCREAAERVGGISYFAVWHFWQGQGSIARVYKELMELIKK